MKVFRIVILVLLLLAGLGLALYSIFVEKDFASKDILKFVLLLCSIVLAFFRPANKKTIANKREAYRSAYGNFIENAFSDDKKLENKLFSAIDDYNQDKCARAITKLEKLRKSCQRTSDIRAVTIFLALCSDDLGLYSQAAGHYEAAIGMRPDTTLYSNLGRCRLQLGQFPQAEQAYTMAIRLDNKNAFAYNNMAALYFKQGDYETALVYAQQAIDHNGKLPQALSTAAICCALLGDMEQYQQYYRQAVLNGYDGKKIKAAVEALDESM